MEITGLLDEHVAGVVRLLRDANPHQLLSEAGFRHGLASSPPEARSQRWVALDGDEVVGTGGGSLHVWAERTDAAFVGATVRPEHRCRGVGGELFERALAHVRGTGAVRALAESGDPDGHGFLGRRGFERTHTRRYSRIDPRAADRSALAGLQDRLAAEGFTVVPLGACRPEDVHFVDLETTQDIPMDVAIATVPFDDWAQLYWRHPQMTLEGSLAVLHEGSPVTVTLLRVDGDRAMNDMTGTLREFRGRGLARLVKLAQLEWAAQNGIASVVTENDATNAPMLAVNARLGYRPFHEVGSYAREPA